MRSLLTLVLTLNLLFVSAQTQTIRTSVYFDTDKHSLRKDAKEILDGLADSIKGLRIIKIFIKGNTDNRADSLYNRQLSLKRTNAVTGYLVSKNIPAPVFTREHYGEEKPVSTNGTDQGKQKNRRVDIIVLYQVKKEVVKPVVPEETLPPVPIPKDTCSRDTVIYFKNGSQVVFNRCEYLEKKDCMELEEILTPEDAIRTGLSTFDDALYPLSSCGMMNFGLKPGCTNECFKKPVIVRFPARDLDCRACGRGAILFSINPNNLLETHRHQDEAGEDRWKRILPV